MTRFARENARWIHLFDEYLLNHLHILDDLPENIHFILMPEDDPELAYYHAQVANRNIEREQIPVKDLSSLLFDKSVV